MKIDSGDGPVDAVVRLPTPASGTRAILVQRAALEAVAGRIPAPALLWSDDGEDNPFSRPFLVMERIAGEVPVGWHELPEPRRARVGEHAMEVLAALHEVDSSAMSSPNDKPSASPTELGWYRRRLERLEPLPAVLTGALWWLERHEPPPPSRSVLVHGDYRMGNLIVQGDRITGVLDWEMAAPGDPLADLAWCFIPLWAPPGVDEPALIRLLRGAHGRRGRRGALSLAPRPGLRAARLLRAGRHARVRLEDDRTICASPRCASSCRFTSTGWRLRSPGRRSYEREERLMSQWAEATTIGDLLIRSAANRPDHEAIVFPHARFTYREVADRAVRAARSLAALGVGRGDHVGLLMPNCPDFVLQLLRRPAARRRRRADQHALPVARARLRGRERRPRRAADERHRRRRGRLRRAPGRDLQACRARPTRRRSSSRTRRSCARSCCSAREGSARLPSQRDFDARRTRSRSPTS